MEGETRAAFATFPLTDVRCDRSICCLNFWHFGLTTIACPGVVSSSASGVALYAAGFVVLVRDIIIQQASDEVLVPSIPAGGIFSVFGITLRCQAHLMLIGENNIC